MIWRGSWGQAFGRDDTEKKSEKREIGFLSEEEWVREREDLMKGVCLQLSFLSSRILRSPALVYPRGKVQLEMLLGGGVADPQRLCPL